MTGRNKYWRAPKLREFCSVPKSLEDYSTTENARTTIYHSVTSSMTLYLGEIGVGGVEIRGDSAREKLSRVGRGIRGEREIGKISYSALTFGHGKVGKG